MRRDKQRAFYMDVEESKLETPKLRPSPEHEARVAVLDDLAMMMDFTMKFEMLPDSSRPDICRFNPFTNGIFIGEAKASESPKCLATELRYRNYLNWLAASRAVISSSVCAICFGNAKEASGWRIFLVEALTSSGLHVAHVEIRKLDWLLNVALATLSTGIAPM